MSFLAAAFSALRVVAASSARSASLKALFQSNPGRSSGTRIGVACDAVHRSRRAASPHQAQPKSANGVKECPKMYLTSEIVKDTPAARRFRLLAPLVILLAFAALALAPGIIGN